MPLFSVVTVTRDNLPGLIRTGQSLSAQTFRDFEWIVIDGASRDGSAAWLAQGHARWLSEPDGGIYDAMNKGIERATGEIVLFLNAGDTLAGSRILADVAALPGNDFIYGDGREGGFYKPARRHTRLGWGLFTYHQAMFYRRAVIGGLRYDTSYMIAADYKFTVEFLRRAHAVLYWPHAVCEFESGGLSQAQAGRGRRELLRARRALGIAVPPVNAAIFAGQTVTWHVRRLVPRLYERLRGRGA